MEPQRMALSLDEVARCAGLSKRKIHELALTGALASVKIGRRRLITTEALSAFLTKHTQPAIDSAEIARKILAKEKPSKKISI